MTLWHWARDLEGVQGEKQQVQGLARVHPRAKLSRGRCTSRVQGPQYSRTAESMESGVAALGAALRVTLGLRRPLLYRASPLQLPWRTGKEKSRSSAFLRDLGWRTSTGCPHMTLLLSQTRTPSHTGWALRVNKPFIHLDKRPRSSSHLSSQPIHATVIRLQFPKGLWTGMVRLGNDRTSCEWWCTRVRRLRQEEVA